MPRGDGTGPEGQGPQTGRGLGYCSGHDTPGFTKGTPRGGGGFGAGYGKGYGRGYGRGRFAYPRRNVSNRVPRQNLTESQKKQSLQNEKEDLKRELDDLESRIESAKERMKELED